MYTEYIVHLNSKLFLEFMANGDYNILTVEWALLADGLNYLTVGLTKAFSNSKASHKLLS